MSGFTPNDPQLVENILAEVKRSGRTTLIYFSALDI